MMRIHSGLLAGAALLVACAPARETAMIGMPAPAAVREMFMDWPAASREAAEMMTTKYGNAHEATASMLVWHNVGPWKHIYLSRVPVQHNFPMPHQDVLEQVINYHVSADKVDELAAYDGSVIYERTKGELSARCDKEGANFLALNLAHEIVTGKRSVEEARRMYAEQIKAKMENRPAPYTEGLLFTPQPNTADPDRPVM